MKSFFIYSGIAVGMLITLLFIPVPAAFATTNINSPAAQRSAWNDEIGWIDFFTTGNVNVNSAQLQGYASSSVGYISLDCATSPNNNICSSGNGNYKVSNDGAGKLSGWAWNDEIGWISFYWGNASASSTFPPTGLCLSYSSGYCGVYIDSGGVFHGWAWNDTVGWISFNCSNNGGLCPYPFNVTTAWAAQSKTGTLDSQTFDTGVASGVQLNSITWKGITVSGTMIGTVNFQIAVSNSSSGPWNFIGQDGTSRSTYYCPGNGCTISLGNYSLLIGRYFRYRVILGTDPTQTFSPSVTSVIINWSP